MNGPDSYPDQAERMAERLELFRIAAQSALDRSQGGKTLSPDARRWALHWSRVKPLGRPLGTGEPAHARVLGDGQEAA